MYVIRPQFFVPFINLLVQISRKSLEYKKQLILAQSKDIDATIAKLQKVRDELVGSENNLRLANQDTEDLTIRKLTYKNPTMKAKFEEARKG